MTKQQERETNNLIREAKGLPRRGRPPKPPSKPPRDRTKGVHFRLEALEHALAWAAETACRVGLHDADTERFLERLARLTPEAALEAARYADAEQMKEPLPAAWEEEFWEGLEKELDKATKTLAAIESGGHEVMIDTEVRWSALRLAIERALASKPPPNVRYHHAYVAGQREALEGVLSAMLDLETPSKKG